MLVVFPAFTLLLFFNKSGEHMSSYMSHESKNDTLYISTQVRHIQRKTDRQQVTLHKVDETFYLKLTASTGSKPQVINPWWRENSPTPPLCTISLSLCPSLSFTYNPFQPLTPGLTIPLSKHCAPLPVMCKAYH